jgi:hypothetical protein
MDTKHVEVARLWVNQNHGPVLLLNLDNIPEDIKERTITVCQDNYQDVIVLLQGLAPWYFYDPYKMIDAAFRDKMLCL